MKVLITGGAGQVAYALGQKQPEDIQAICLVRQICNINDPKSIEKAFNIYQPNWVINCAAYTAVDKAEAERDAAMLINHFGAANLARACQKFNIPLCHLSTDYVFNGNQNTPYKETDHTDPCNYYGLTKYLGEQSILQHCKQAIILRVSSVFGQQGHNFVKTIKQLSEQHDEIKIVADQYCCPTAADDIAIAIYKIMRQIHDNSWGIYHYVGTPSTTWYQFAKTIVEELQKINCCQNTAVTPITTAEYPVAAKRPLNSVLNCDKIHKTFNLKAANWSPRLTQLILHLVQTAEELT